MAQKDAEWKIDLSRPTGDKSVPRTSVARGLLSEANGLDGTISGGSRPFAGFRQVRELEFDNYAPDDNGDGAANDTRLTPYLAAGGRQTNDTGAAHGEGSEVIDFYPVTFMRGTSSTCYGYVYRVKRKDVADDNVNADVFIEFYDTGAAIPKWYTPNDPADPGASGSGLNYTGQLLMLGCSSTEPMSVETLGRLVYVFVRGRSPSVFFLDGGANDVDPENAAFNGSQVIGVTGESSATGNTGVPGPGFRPDFLDIDQATVIGSLPTPDTNDRRPGSAQLLQSNKSAEDLPELFGDFDQPGIRLDDFVTTPTVTHKENTLLPGSLAATVNTYTSSGTNFGTSGTALTTGQRVVVVVNYRATNTATSVSPGSTDSLRKGPNQRHPGCIVDFVDGTGGSPSVVNTFQPAGGCVGSKDAISSGMSVYDVYNTGANFSEQVTYTQVFECRPFNDLKTSDAGGTGTAIAANMYVRVRPLTGTSPTDTATLSVTDLSVNIYLIDNVNDDEFCIPTSSLKWKPETVLASQSTTHLQEVGLSNLSSTGSTHNYTYPTLVSGSTVRRMGLVGVGDGSVQFPNTAAGTTNNPALKNGYLSTQAFVPGASTVKRSASAVISTTFGRVRRRNDQSAGTSLFGTNEGDYFKNFFAANVVDQDYDTSNPPDGTGEADALTFPAIHSSGTPSANRVATLRRANNTLNSNSFADEALCVAQTLNSSTATGGQLISDLSFDTQFTFPSIAANNPDGTSPDDLQLQSHWHTMGFEIGANTTSPGNWTNQSSTSKSGVTGQALDFLNSLIVARAPVDRALQASTQSDLVWEITEAGTFAGNVTFDVYWNDPEAIGRLVKVASDVSSFKFEITSLYDQGILPSGRTFQWGVIAKTTVNGVDYQKVSQVFEFTTDDIFKSHRFDRGNYAFAYQLFDSKTGRTSGMSQIARIDKSAFKYGTTGRCGVSGREYDEENEDLIELISSPQVVPKGIREYTCVELCYDVRKYDYAFFYRSPRTEDEALNFAPNTLFLDKLIKLDDYKTLDNTTTNYGIDVLPTSLGGDTASTRQRVVFFYTLNEDELLYRPLYTGPLRFDDNMPQAGTAKFLDNILVAANITPPAITTLNQGTEDEFTAADPYRGGGETKYSQVEKYAAELFPPQNQYTPSDPSNRILALVRTGPNMLGLSEDRLYHIRREQGVMVRELHEGMVGTVNPEACTVAASQLFTIAPRGVKIVGTNGSLDNMAVLDVLIREKWKDNQDKLKVAFDPFISSLFFYNPTLGHAACTWFETSSMTELVDLPFTDVKHANFPNAETFATTASGTGYSPTFGGDRVHRSLWLMNHPDVANNVNTRDETVAGYWRPRIYVANHERDRKALTGGDTAVFAQQSYNRRTLMDIIGPTLFTLASGHGSTSLVCTAGNGNSQAASDSCVGAYVYVLEDTDQSKIGNKAQIKSVTKSASAITITLMTSLDCSASAKIGISPVFVECTAHQVGIPTQTSRGASELDDHHYLKQIDETRIHVLEVEGNNSSDTACKFQGILYDGNGDLVSSKNVPVKPDGTNVASLTDGSSLYPAVFGSDSTFSGVQGPLGFTLTPGIRIFCPDVDYRLQSMVCNGQIMDTKTSQAYTQS
mgnify:FL=1